MDLIEVLDRLTEVSKELLDICREQAEIIEQHDLISADDALQARGRLEQIRGEVNGMGNI